MAVVISSTSGTIGHGNALTITGTGFGSKSLTNYRFDDCQGTDPTVIWTGTNIQPTSDATYNIAYRSTFGGISQPHTHGSKYLAGCHATTAGEFNQVWVSTPLITPSYPDWETIDYWWRVHSSWAFGNNSPADDNFKFHTPGLVPLGNGGEFHQPLPDVEPFWYAEYEDGSFTSASAPGLVADVSDSGSMGYFCDSVSGGIGACHSGGGSQTVGYSVTGLDNPAADWVHYRVQIRWDRNSTGWVRMWDKGVQIMSTNGATDRDTASPAGRMETIGSYARSRGTNNWRFFRDIYFDRGAGGLAMVEVGPGSTHATKGHCEIQPLTSWSTTSIAITLNDGHFGGLTGKYLYVTDSAGLVNSNGFALADAGGSGPPCVFRRA